MVEIGVVEKIRDFRYEEKISKGLSKSRINRRTHNTMTTKITGESTQSTTNDLQTLPMKLNVSY